MLLWIGRGIGGILKQVIHMGAPVVVVMGVCGVGKTRVARALADRLGAGFVEADDFHSAANKARMAGGDGLSDADRMPWLADVAKAVDGTLKKSGPPIVLACSALRRGYRDVLRARLDQVFFVHLHGSRDLIAARLGQRQGHFVGPQLLDSQLRVLEPLQDDETGIEVEIDDPADAVVDHIVNLLSRRVPEASEPRGRARQT